MFISVFKNILVLNNFVVVRMLRLRSRKPKQRRPQDMFQMREGILRIFPHCGLISMEFGECRIAWTKHTGLKVYSLDKLEREVTASDLQRFRRNLAAEARVNPVVSEFLLLHPEIQQV